MLFFLGTVVLIGTIYEYIKYQSDVYVTLSIGIILVTLGRFMWKQERRKRSYKDHRYKIDKRIRGGDMKKPLWAEFTGIIIQIIVLIVVAIIVLIAIKKMA